MCDGFLVLAQIQNDDTSNKPLGSTPSCFFVPRWLPNGERNPFYIQRLKDKLGNRSNASSEVEFNNTQGVCTLHIIKENFIREFVFQWLLGNEHEGVKTIIEMVHGTRLDSAVGSAALTRQGLIQVQATFLEQIDFDFFCQSQATWHARHRKAFGRLLIDQPLMKQVLSDLLLESEAATALVMYVASLFDSISHTSEMKSFARIATAIAKFWVCKRTPEATVEALECLGGAGFVEESNMPRLYREAPLNSIW